MKLRSDIVCQVLARTRSEKQVYDVLENFIPNRNDLSGDYAINPNGGIFESEKEMVKYFANADHLAQTFYWSDKSKDLNKCMVGADFTSDSELILSLTLDVTESEAGKYLSQLKLILDSDIGVISHHVLADYKDGADFKRRYGELAA